MLLRGECVTLRQAHSADRAELERLRTDPEIDYYMGADAAPRGSIWNRIFVGAASGALVDFVIEGPERRAIGLLSFWERSIPHQAAELSIWLARGRRDRGYGTDAVRVGLRYVFSEFNLHKVYLRVLPYNVRAIACYEKCGFRQEGVLRQEMCVGGRWYDLIYMGLLRAEFEVQERQRTVAASAYRQTAVLDPPR